MGLCPALLFLFFLPVAYSCAMRVFLSVVATGLLLGCGSKSNSTAANSTNSVADSNSAGMLTAPVDYLRAINKGKQDAIKTVDTASLDKAIQMFNLEQGHNPKDLDELVQKKYIPTIPAAPYGMKLVYDASSGSVSVQKQ
jgi:hypothetical protein